VRDWPTREPLGSRDPSIGVANRRLLVLVICIVRLGGVSSSTLLGKGDGTFEAPLDLGPGCDGVPVGGDLNRDGNWGLLVSSVLLGKGDGTFVRGPIPWQPWDNFLGDFTGDGILDLVTLKDAWNSPDQAIHVSTGYGDGSFFHAACAAR
jgi:hypothetical protein